MIEDVDVVVIGMGPGGEDVAARVARGGLDVIGIDRNLVGGECPYCCCVPARMMIRAAGSPAEVRRVAGLAGRAQAVPHWAPVARRIREEATDDWDDTVAVERFEKAGGRFVRGALVGATSVGPAGGEVLGALSLAVHAEVPTETFNRMTFAYPTFHRGISDALRDLGEVDG